MRSRRTVAAQLGALAVTLAVGVGIGWSAHAAGDGEPRRSPSPSATRPLAEPVVDCHLTFTVYEFGCGIVAVQGTHAGEGTPEGTYCRVTLRVDNHDPSYHDYVTRGQRLAGVAAPRNRPDPFAMGVRRQPDRIRIGGHNAVEVELWYDVPKNAAVTGLRLSGDRDPVAYQSDDVVPHRKGGVRVRLKPADESP